MELLPRYVDIDEVYRAEKDVKLHHSRRSRGSREREGSGDEEGDMGDYEGEGDEKGEEEGGGVRERGQGVRSDKKLQYSAGRREFYVAELGRVEYGGDGEGGREGESSASRHR